ncbi:hypothetical protein Mapa_004132 [Marchantia paleacea]|nr:hypothetical protein Mapa_004132 [Marchantia paleacea]
MVTREEWDQKLAAADVRKEDMNKLIMDFFLTQGYIGAAKQFQIESGTEPNMSFEDVSKRIEIRNAVWRGDVEEGIMKANELNPDILDSNPQLSFDLQQQHVIELIRESRVMEALECAQENLAPYCIEADDTFFRELERTVVLLAFKDPASCPVGELMDIKKREQAAMEIDHAILMSQGHERDPKLHFLLKLLVWAQTKLGEKASYPRIDHIAEALYEHEDCSQR